MLSDTGTPWFIAGEGAGGGGVPRRRRSIVPLILVAVVVISLGLAAFAPLREKPRGLEDGEVLMPATLTEVVAGCAGIVFTPSNADDTLQQNSPVFVYQHLPPSSGNWSLPAAAPGVYGADAVDLPKVSQAVAALREGRVVIWYNPDISPERFSALTSIVQSSPYGERITVLPWLLDNSTRKGWLENRNITYTSWGVRLNCDVASSDVLDSFMQQAFLNPLAREERAIAGFTLGD